VIASGVEFVGVESDAFCVDGRDMRDGLVVTRATRLPICGVTGNY
jgi:hypothetical protein